MDIQAAIFAASCKYSAEFGKIRALISDNGQNINSAGPSTPLEVLGLSGTPNAGDEMIAVPDEKKAREITLFRQAKFRESKIAEQQAMKLENIMSQMEDGKIVSLNILIKADVQGSSEALVDAVLRLSNEEVKVRSQSKRHKQWCWWYNGIRY